MQKPVVDTVYQAISRGDIDILLNLMECHHIDVSDTFEWEGQHHTLLSLALQLGQMDIGEWLFQKGAKFLSEHSGLGLMLNATQRYQLLQFKINNAENINAGETLALRLVHDKRYEDFARLTDGLTVEQRFQVLQGQFTNPNCLGAGVTVALVLVSYGRYEDFARLTQGLTVEQRYQVLQGQFTNPNYEFVGETVALLLLLRYRCEDFARLTQGLTVEQRYQVLQGQFTNPNHEFVGMTVARYLLKNKGATFFAQMCREFNHDQIIGLLSGNHHDILAALVEHHHQLGSELLAQCDYEPLVTLYDSLAQDSASLPLVTFHCFVKLTGWLFSVFSMPQGQALDITDSLTQLFSFYHSLASTRYKSPCVDHLESLLQAANDSDVYRTTVIDTLLNKCDYPIFKRLHNVSPKFAIEGFVHFFAALKMNIDDEQQACQLAQRHIMTLVNVENKYLSQSQSGFFRAKTQSSPDGVRGVKRDREACDLSMFEGAEAVKKS